MAFLIGASVLALFAALIMFLGRPGAGPVREEEGLRQLRALLDAELQQSFPVPQGRVRRTITKLSRIRRG